MLAFACYCFSHKSLRSSRTPCQISTQLHGNRNPRKQYAISNRRSRFFPIRSTAHSDHGKWMKWLPGKVIPVDNILKTVSGATTSPIFKFIPFPFTFLHSLDPRIKLVWALVLVVLPVRSHAIIGCGLVITLALISISLLPRHVWMVMCCYIGYIQCFKNCDEDQLGRVCLISIMLFMMLGFGSDSGMHHLQPRNPPPELTGLPVLPSSLQGYSYIIIKCGPFLLTRKSLSVATISSCFSFIMFQSSNLLLSSTRPDHLASALCWFMRPLVPLRVPVPELILTLLLSLRFLNIVFDEVRNVALGIVSRRINYADLTATETLDVLFAYIRRVLKNISVHTEQISRAMVARGFGGDSDRHQMYYIADLPGIKAADVRSMFALGSLIVASVLSQKVHPD